MMKVHLIWAQSTNGVIGLDGAMPWHLPEDLAHFKRTTLGCPVVMGRKTWDSLPPKFRPLPGRKNIVITRQTDWRPEPASAEVKRASSLSEALALSEGFGLHLPAEAVLAGVAADAQALADARSYAANRSGRNRVSTSALPKAAA